MACVIGPSVTTSSTDFSFLPKPSFFGIYLNFQPQKSLLNQYIPHSEIQILPNNSIKILLIKIFPTTPKANSIKSWSSRSFKQHQRQIPIPTKFWAAIWFNFQCGNHSIFENFCTASPKHPWNQANAPLLLQSFPKRPRMRSEASQFHGSHQYKTKQTNYLAS